MKVVVALLLFLLEFAVNGSGAYRILGVFPAPAYSHYALGSRLMKELAEKGHDVVMVSAFKEKNPPRFYKEIVLEDLVEKAEEQKKDMFKRISLPPHMLFFFMNGFGEMMVNSTFTHNEVQQLLHNPKEKFDLIIIEQFMVDALKAFSYHFKCPLIAFSTVGSGHWVNGLVGNPAPRSYVADVLLSYDGRMNFWQRLDNLLMGFVAEFNDRFLFFPKQNQYIQKYFPGAPSVEELNTNVSLVLLNSHVSTHQPVPHVPNMIEIGGFHVHPPKPLPKDLQDYLDNAKEGVVYFSMGSNLKSKNLPQETRQAILNVFSKLKESVLWKFEEDLPGRPANVKIEKWLPQQDVLAHPNVKVFITHGGLLSTTEAIYHGVPLLGIPVFGDQKLNMAKAVASGFALKVDFHYLTEETLGSALNEVLSNKKYKENAKTRSKILHDQPIKPLDNAIYWCEYVVRHKGATHFRSAALDLTWYQYYMVDVAALLVAISFVSTYATYKVLRFVLCRRKGNGKKKFD